MIVGLRKMTMTTSGLRGATTVAGFGDLTVDSAASRHGWNRP
jgi:hypothetical protein